MDWVNQIEKINNKFKFQLFGRTINNLDAFYDKAKQFDPSLTGTMGAVPLNLYLNACGVFLTTQQLRIIGDAFPSDSITNTTDINYNDFINYVRHDISQKRKAVIDHVYAELSANGPLTTQALISRFVASEHPHVRSMMQKEEKAQQDFVSAINRRSADGTHFNEQQFIEYFYDVNACVPREREEFFVDILMHGFRMVDHKVTLDRLREMEVTLFQKVRQKTYFKRDEGIKSQNTFKYFDLEDKSAVDYTRFSQTLQRLGCAFAPFERYALFLKHANEQKYIQYAEMCALLFDMGSGKKEVKNPVYELARNGTGVITTHGMTKALS